MNFFILLATLVIRWAKSKPCEYTFLLLTTRKSIYSSSQLGSQIEHSKTGRHTALRSMGFLRSPLMLWNLICLDFLLTLTFIHCLNSHFSWYVTEYPSCSKKVEMFYNFSERHSSILNVFDGVAPIWNFSPLQNFEYLWVWPDPTKFLP